MLISAGRHVGERQRPNAVKCSEREAPETTSSDGDRSRGRGGAERGAAEQRRRLECRIDRSARGESQSAQDRRRERLDADVADEQRRQP